MPLQDLERTLRVKLAETLPGVEAQKRFAPTARTGWKADYFPGDARIAAALLLIYDSRSFVSAKEWAEQDFNASGNPRP